MTLSIDEKGKDNLFTDVGRTEISESERFFIDLFNKYLLRTTLCPALCLSPGNKGNSKHRWSHHHHKAYGLKGKSKKSRKTTSYCAVCSVGTSASEVRAHSKWIPAHMYC